MGKGKGKKKGGSSGSQLSKESGVSSPTTTKDEGDSSSAKSNVKVDLVEICVEFAEADLAFTKQINGDACAETAMLECLWFAREQYATRASLDPEHIVAYPIDGLGSITVKEWAGRTFGTPPTVILSTDPEKGLLAKCKAMSSTMSKELEQSDKATKLATRELKDERKAKEETAARYASELKLKAESHEAEQRQKEEANQALQKQLDKLLETLTSLVSQVDQLKTQVQGQGTRIAVLETENAALETQVQGQGTRIALLETENAALATQVEGQGTRIALLETENAALRSNVEALTKQCSESAEKIVNLETYATSLNALLNLDLNLYN